MTVHIQTKVFPLVCALAISCSVTACSGKEPVYASENAVAKGSQTQAAPSEPLPLDEVFSQISVNGTTFTLPCKADAFKGDFSYKPRKDSEGWFEIYYKGVVTGSFTFKDKYNYDIKNDLIDGYFFHGDFDIGGFKSGMKQDDLIPFFGEPDKTFSRSDSDTVTESFYTSENYYVQFSRSLFETDAPEDTVSDVFISCGKQISDPVEDDFRKITVCGTEFSIPFTAADLTGDFSYRENSGRLDILHKEKVIGEITYTDGLSDYTDAIPAAVTFNEDADFTIGSFSEGMKLYELRECLGKPTEQLFYPGEGFGTESYYVFRDMMIDFRNTKIDKSQKVDYVCFYLDVEDGHHGHYEKKGSFDNVNHILLGDKEISLPFTIESLGDGYSNDAWSILKGGEIVGRYNDKTKDGDMIYGFCITNSESSSINGISMASTKNDIAAVLGEPTIKGAPQYPSSENEYLASFTCDTYYYEGGEIHIYYSDENIREIDIDMYHWQ